MAEKRSNLARVADACRKKRALLAATLTSTLVLFGVSVLVLSRGATWHDSKGVRDVDNNEPLSDENAAVGLSTDVFAPRTAGVIAFDRTLIRELTEVLRPQRGDSLSTLHALPLFGPEVTVDSEALGCNVRVVDLILDSESAGRHFGGARPFCTTRYGARFPVVDSPISPNQGAAQAHPGQALATLASIGLPMSTAIYPEENLVTNLDAVRQDLCANFSLDGEIYWDAVALCLLVPPAASWRNKFADELTFDALAVELANRDLAASACLGIHRLIALTVLLRVDENTGVVSHDARNSVRQALRQAVDLVTANQSPDGHWNSKWPLDSGGSELGGSGRPADDVWDLVATAHHLEWLVLLPRDLAPPLTVFRNAAAWLCKILHERSRDAEWLRKWYCPVSHGVRVLEILGVGGPRDSSNDPPKQVYRPQLVLE